jgi:hypothetical protein
MLRIVTIRVAPREQNYSFRPFNVVRQEGDEGFFICLTPSTIPFR